MRRPRYGIAATLLLFLAPALGRAASVAIPASADAWIDKSLPGANHGADAALSLLRSGGDERRALLRFDVAALPAGAVITEAYLRLHVVAAEPRAFPVEVMPILANWDEATVDWTTGQALLDSTDVIAGFVPGSPGDVRCDVTSIVRDWAAGTRSPYGLALRASAGSDTSSVASREALVALDRPTLVVEVTSGAPDTGYRVATGSYLGTGVAGVPITGVGFAPDVVLVRGAGSSEALMRTSSMAGDLTKGLDSNAAPFTGGIRSLDVDGFTLGADARANAPAVTHYWTAFRADTGRLAVGSYLGNGQVSHSVPVGLSPGYVVVLGENNQVAIQRFLAEGVGSSIAFGGDTEHTNQIQAFLPDGFSVGLNAAVNSSGVRYHYVAWAPTTDASATSGYVGDGSDNRSVTGAGFLPQLVLLKSAQNDKGAFRTTPLAGDATLPFTADPIYADGIQALLPTGFQVGTRNEVNKNGATIYWAAFRSPAFADLAVSELVSDATPHPGDLISWTVTVTNHGPAAASGVVVTELLPPGVTYASHGQTLGAYSAATGRWDVGALAAAGSATLMISATVNAGTAGTRITDWVDVTGCDQPDSVRANQADSASIDVARTFFADLAMHMTADQPLPVPGGIVDFTLSVSNAGSLDATSVIAEDPLPAGLSFVSAAAAKGVYYPATGVWDVGSVTAGEATSLLLRASVDAGTEGLTLENVAGITSLDQTDADPSNDADSVAISVQNAAMEASALPQDGHALLPGASTEPVFQVALHNRSAAAETLLAFTLDDASTGGASATPADLDADWQPLELVVLRGGEPLQRSAASFSGGQATFHVSRTIAPGDSLELEVHGGASLAARDGDVLDVQIAGAASFSFSPSVAVAGTFPLAPAGSFPVDGLVSAQIALGAVAPSLLSGDVRRVALDARLPSNGYEDDVLRRFDVMNLGSAAAVSDLARLEAWVDDGDGTFSPALDRRLGELAFTGRRWEITGLTETVPARTGLHLFVTVDVAELATPGSTVQLAFPGPPDLGIGMTSDDDGPIDRSAASAVQTISTQDRVTLTALAIAAGSVHPGAAGVPMLEMAATNSYGQARTLTTVRVHDASSGAGTLADLDAQLHRLVLQVDDGDGVVEGAAADSVLGVAFFVGGDAAFSGLHVVLAAGETRRLWLSADISLPLAADGDVLALDVPSADQVAFAEPTAAVASWPLDSGARWSVDGMVAAQMTIAPSPAVTLGPNEGPALALDVTVPSRGYAADVLQQWTVENEGTATSADIAELRLWRDGGDGTFDAGATDDVDLGALAPFGAEWTHPALAQALPPGGARFFVSVRASASPGESTSVRLAVPIDGLQVASGNDGPIDVEAASANTILFSTAVLLASLRIDPAASTVDSTVAVTMTVRNVHPTATLDSVAPSGLVASGTGLLSLLSGPAPASRTLGPGESGTFAWVYRASSAGDVRLGGWAEGAEQGSGTPHRSLGVESNQHRVFLRAQDLDLYAVESMPFSISRGQAGVVPVSLTFENPAGAAGSDIRVTGLRLRIEDENGAGIVPASLLSRVVVNEGAVVYVEKTSLETTGADVDLGFTRPLVVESGAGSNQSTVAISFDISASTAVPTFRLKLVDATWITAEDATSGGPVAVTLRRPDAFPVASGLARVVAEAERLEVSASGVTALSAGRGQHAVPFLGLTLLNPDAAGLAADVRIPTFAVRLVDSTGAAILTPGQWLQSLRVDSGPIVYLDRAVGAADDSTIVLTFAPLVSVPVNAPVNLRVAADLDATAPLRRVRLELADSTRFDARDANTGAHVPVVLATSPVPGPWVAVQAPVDSLAALGTAVMPPVVGVGSADVPAMSVVLSNPGAAGTASASIDSLTLRCRDGSAALLAPATYLGRVRVLVAGTEVGLVTNVPSTGDVTVPLGGVTVGAGGTVSLDVRFNAEITAPASLFELIVPAGGVHARDANLGMPVAVAAPSGGFPLMSGLAQLRLPARDVLASFADRMPAVLAADDRPLAVATLTLRNPAPATAGEVRVAALTVHAAAGDLGPLDLGAAVSSVTAHVAGALWASSVDLDPSAPTALLAGADTLVIAPGQSVQIALEIALRSGSDVPSLRIGLDAADVGVVQPGGLLSVAVGAESGQSLPFWTQAGNFSGTTLAESWSNFPNPFAAGRERTALVFYLPRDGRVSLKVWTLRGEVVRSLLESAALPAGLHQETSWDGRNGRGDVVRNGVYLAEIAVSYADGTSETLRRKVAVVR